MLTFSFSGTVADLSEAIDNIPAYVKRNNMPAVQYALLTKHD